MMLGYFFSEIKDVEAAESRRMLFESLKIGQYPEIIKEHMGKYPVVYVSLKKCRGNTWEKISNKMYPALLNAIRPYVDDGTLAISEVIVCPDFDPFSLKEIPFRWATRGLFTSLVYLLRKIHEIRQRCVLLLMDDIHAPLREKMISEDADLERYFEYSKFMARVLRVDVAIWKSCFMARPISGRDYLEINTKNPFFEYFTPDDSTYRDNFIPLLMSTDHTRSNIDNSSRFIR
jgi:hypothetical protein